VEYKLVINYWPHWPRRFGPARLTRWISEFPGMAVDGAVHAY